MFTTMDTSNDGLLTRKEIKQGLLKLKCPAESGPYRGNAQPRSQCADELDEFITSMDKNSDDVVDYAEFAAGSSSGATCAVSRAAACKVAGTRVENRRRSKEVTKLILPHIAPKKTHIDFDDQSEMRCGGAVQQQQY